MEQALLENRVRKLKIEENHLQKQIKMANKNSEFADQVRNRKENDERNNEMAAHMEQLRVARQHAENTYQRNRISQNVQSQRNRHFDSCCESREDMNQFLRTNYEKFFAEKTANQNDKSQNAADAYNARQQMMARMKHDKEMDYANTTNNCGTDAKSSFKLRE